jgi:hypothetical protein
LGSTPLDFAGFLLRTGHEADETAHAYAGINANVLCSALEAIQGIDANCRKMRRTVAASSGWISLSFGRGLAGHQSGDLATGPWCVGPVQFDLDQCPELGSHPMLA